MRTKNFKLMAVRGITVDRDAKIYFINANAIYQIDANRKVKLIAGHSAEEGYRDGALDVARFNRPSGIAVGADGTVFVADTFNRVIRKISRSRFANFPRFISDGRGRQVS